MHFEVKTQVEIRDKKNSLRLVAKGYIQNNTYDTLSRRYVAMIACTDGKVREVYHRKDNHYLIWEGSISDTDVDNMLCIASLQWHRNITSLKTLTANLDNVSESEIIRLCKDSRYIDVVKITVMQSNERTRRGFIKNIEKKDLDIDEIERVMVKRFRIDPKDGDSLYSFIENSYYY